MPISSSSNQGPVVRLVFNETSVDSIIEMGFSRILVERSVTATGDDFAELTRPSDRLVLTRGQPEYSFIDRRGDKDYRYRIRYVSEDGCLVSDPSDPEVGSGPILQQIITVDELKARYLFGVSLTDDAGNELPDSTYQHFIAAAVTWMERQLDVPIVPTTFLLEGHDYYAQDFHKQNVFQLENYPTLSVEDFQLAYPGATPISYPAEWVHLDKHHGLVRIVPATGSISQYLIAQGNQNLPMILSRGDHFPDLFRISYTAGFDPVPSDIIELIGMAAALGPLNLFGDLIAGAGIANTSLSIDGLSQSIGTTSSATNSGYGSRIIQYNKQIKEQIPTLRRFFKGIRMVSA